LCLAVENLIPLQWKMPNDDDILASSQHSTSASVDKIIIALQSSLYQQNQPLVAATIKTSTKIFLNISIYH